MFKLAATESELWVAHLEFKELVAKRRSIRKFKKDSVSEKLLKNILKACRWSPSAGNSQPWHIIVVTDTMIKAKMAGTCTKYSKEHWRKLPSERVRYLAARGGTWDKSYMKDVPVLMVVSYETEKGFRNELALGSAWIAVENMMLAATDEGLASCVYTFLNRREENKIGSLLQVPRTHRVACLLQVGYADVEPLPPSRKELKEIVSYQQF
jgi:nitroreductase